MLSPLPPAPIPEKTILVIEDDPAVRNSLKFSLEIEGYRVRLFADEKDVLALGEIPPSVCIVVDHGLPDGNGLGFVAALRARGYGTPAILITTHPPADLRRWAAAIGVPIVEKPLLGDALIEAIRTAVGDG